MSYFKTYAVLPLSLALLSACSVFDDSEYMKLEELAAPDDEYIVEADFAGADTTFTFPVYASADVHVEMIGEVVDWARIDKTVLENGDASVSVTVQPNDSFRRMFRVAFALDGTAKRDTVCIRQKGVVPYLEAKAPYQSAGGKLPETAVFKIQTNIPAENFTTVIEYDGDQKDWLEVTEITSDRVYMLAHRNTTDHLRRGVLTMSYIDGWEEHHSLRLVVLQADKDDDFGQSVGFEHLKSLATGQGYKVEEDILLTGVVVSDCRSRNMAENVNVDYSVVDTTVALKTAYLESMDGSMGVKLIFADEGENNLTFGSKISVNLRGTVLTGCTDPVRYEISEMSEKNIQASFGEVPVPVKRKMISELEDSDIYTYVSLTGTEFAIKNGSYSNVLERLVQPSALNVDPDNPAEELGGYAFVKCADSWGNMMIDYEGSAIYAPVNSMCQWRRTGEGLPKGYGVVSGVIVSEDHLRWGNVGKYQIRVIDKSGFALSEASATSWTELTKWDSSHADSFRWLEVDGDESKYYLKTSLKHKEFVYKGLETVIPSDDYSNANPKARLYIENTVCDPTVTEPLLRSRKLCSVVPSVIKDGYYSGEINKWALRMTTSLSGWYDYDEDGELSGTRGLRFHFDATEVSGSEGLLFKFEFAAGTYNAMYVGMYPAHWCVEYSVDEGSTYTIVREAASGSEYVSLRPIAYPSGFSGGSSYNPSLYAAPGFTQHVYLLPSELFGKKFRVRIRPYDEVLTSLSLDWRADIETGKMTPGLEAENDFRFGTMSISYR